MKEKLDMISNSFSTFFFNCGYFKKHSVPIISGCDPTVTFVGSGISVLKPLLRAETFSYPGVFVKQKAIRTHPLKNITRLEEGVFGSFFEAFCVLTHYERLEILMQELMTFLVDRLRVPPSSVVFRVSSADLDLLSVVNNLKYNLVIQIDTEEEKYYRHKYGMDEEGVCGRNLNFTLQNSSALGLDVGNIIVIERNKSPIAVELAFGCQTMAMVLYGIQKSIQANYIADLMPLDTVPQRKLADAIVVTSNLEYEGINLCKNRFPVYLYRKYLRGLEYWKECLGIDDNQLHELKTSYLNLEYNKNTNENN